MLKLEKIYKKLGKFALSDINLEVCEGDYFVLLGRSGSGKSQLLELIAGLSTPDSGSVLIDGKDVTMVRIQERRTGLVFQDYAIFPNMTVAGNIGYALHGVKLSAREKEEKIRAISSELNVVHLLGRNTHNLSGGELQRVALARTLVTSPRLLLLDEPLSSIDASLKDDIRRLFRRLNRNGLTIIHVTHDYNEAVSLAGKVGVIHNGRIIQTGPPDEVFSRPANRFVARYAGIRNFFSVRFIQGNSGWIAKSEGGSEFKITGNTFPSDGIVIIKNECILLHPSKPADAHDNLFTGQIKDILPTSKGAEIMVDTGEKFFADVSHDEMNRLEPIENMKVWISVKSSDLLVMGK